MDKIIELLKESGAMLEGHFLLSSGKHSDKYFQCAKLLQYPDKTKLVFEFVIQKIKENISAGNLKIDIVIGPAMGGIIPAWEAARQLGLPAIFTERDDKGIMTLRRGFELQKGQNILIAEDVITTGKSSLECAAALESFDVKISALACIVDRRLQPSDELPWQFFPAVTLSAASWDPCECQLCKQEIPLIKPGSRKI